jgi:hypothetical protein
MRAVPRLCGFYPGICLTNEEKARKNLSQGSHMSLSPFVSFVTYLLTSPRTYLLYLNGMQYREMESSMCENVRECLEFNLQLTENTINIVM